MRMNEDELTTIPTDSWTMPSDINMELIRMWNLTTDLLLNPNCNDSWLNIALINVFFSLSGWLFFYFIKKIAGLVFLKYCKKKKPINNILPINNNLELFEDPYYHANEL